MKHLLQKYPILCFFTLIYALSTPFWLISAVFKNSNLPLNIPIGDIVAAFTPLFAALFITWRTKGRVAAKKILASPWDFRKLSFKAVSFAILAPLCIYIISYFAFFLLGYTELIGISASFAAIAALFIFFYLGAAGEEIGYTAYATNTLVTRYGKIGAAIAIGTPWAVWHFPSMLIQGRSLELAWIAGAIISMIAVRYLYIILYKNTAGCVSAVIFMHAIFNVGRAVFPGMPAENLLFKHELIYYLVITLFAIMIGLLFHNQTLAKKASGQKHT